MAQRYILAKFFAARGCRKFRIARTAHCGARRCAHENVSRTARSATEPRQWKTANNRLPSGDGSGGQIPNDRQGKPKKRSVSVRVTSLDVTSEFTARQDLVPSWYNHKREPPWPITP